MPSSPSASWTALGRRGAYSTASEMNAPFASSSSGTFSAVSWPDGRPCAASLILAVKSACASKWLALTCARATDSLGFSVLSGAADGDRNAPIRAIASSCVATYFTSNSYAAVESEGVISIGSESGLCTGPVTVWMTSPSSSVESPPAAAFAVTVTSPSAIPNTAARTRKGRIAMAAGRFWAPVACLPLAFVASSKLGNFWPSR